MYSVEALAHQVTQTVAMVSSVQGAIEQARSELDEAAQLWRSATVGTTKPEFAQLPEAAGQHVEQLSEQTGLLEQAKQALQRYLASIGTNPSAGPPSTDRDPKDSTAKTSGDRKPVPDRSSPAPAQGLEQRVADYRRKLDHPWPYGRPLRGWRLSSGPEGRDQELASGTKLSTGEVDPAYRAAVKRAEKLGLARGGFVPDIARHIEIKEASTMSEGQSSPVPP